MNVRKEIDNYAAEEHKEALQWLFNKYHMESEWHFVAKCKHIKHGTQSYESHRLWTPTPAGLVLYKYREKLEAISKGE